MLRPDHYVRFVHLRPGCVPCPEGGEMNRTAAVVFIDRNYDPSHPWFADALEVPVGVMEVGSRAFAAFGLNPYDMVDQGQ